MDGNGAYSGQAADMYSAGGTLYAFVYGCVCSGLVGGLAGRLSGACLCLVVCLLIQAAFILHVRFAGQPRPSSALQSFDFVCGVLLIA